MILGRLHRIPQGAELFRPYENFLAPRSERTQQLRERYGFDCACPSCSLPDDESQKSDAIRRLLQDDLTEIFGDEADSESREVFAAWLADVSLPDDHITAHGGNVLRLMRCDGAGLLGHRLLQFVRLWAYRKTLDKVAL
ncbi:hypothetical protein DFH08DRAFT_255284 [Mycena albidolilacea]|uniref:SET domain-containing protein n=1 Tax=Mycena albidolilacea TaxID=1033008 RepID=A0AAD6ZUA3_9AGAR|nr:hypothetical protein DFH08DRAFT_255284 [Mycena albidolilacea]